MNDYGTWLEWVVCAPLIAAEVWLVWRILNAWLDRLATFGFTREDVELLHVLADDFREIARVNDRPTGSSAQYAKQFDDLAARIEALLPPDSPVPANNGPDHMPTRQG